jgi:hypothetical protein
VYRKKIGGVLGDFLVITALLAFGKVSVNSHRFTIWLYEMTLSCAGKQRNRPHNRTNGPNRGFGIPYHCVESTHFLMDQK